MSMGTRDQREQPSTARDAVRLNSRSRRKQTRADLRKHPVLIPALAALATFAIFAIRLGTGRHAALHGSWIFLGAAVAALAIAGLMRLWIWYIRRHTDDRHG